MPANKKKKPKKKNDQETQDDEKKEEIMVLSMEEIEMLAEKMTRQVSLLQKSRSNFQDGGSKLPRNLLLSVEAQQISNTLHSFITNIEIAMTRLSFLHLDTIPDVEDKDLMKSLNSHQISAERLEALEGFRGFSGVQGFEGHAEEDSIRLERDFMESVKNIFRCFQANPEAIFDLKTKSCTGQEGLLLGGLKKFHKQMIERLKNTPDEELQLLLRKQAPTCTLKDMEDIVKLEAEMADIIKKVDSQISEKKEELKYLESQLQADDKKDMSLPLLSDEHCQTCIKSSAVKQAATRKEIDVLSVQLNNLILQNKEAIRELQEKNERQEVEIEEFLNDFDERMEENQELSIHCFHSRLQDGSRIRDTIWFLCPLSWWLVAGSSSGRPSRECSSCGS
ncbi:uncharacterized protein LOC128763100 isoform X2 [Synchiropus splendidus]|uniref:uncharacterized protein LOC128763100 isoform X2 n=1 Tax=Synchiropus splendidus TaxID=270530 RepID=UPI00237DD749|nr:uncharacterized protein LOC128763100 isoform X2 [Synchiropus splendidus]